jgi:formylglycine-generating enzyme required for sulfatase activity/tRNA A-37 threonylcarbamoyl transferase component Bud32
MSVRADDQTERYDNWRIIGSGGMAVVYRVRDNVFGLDVAIKVIKEKYRGNQNVVDSLLGEVLISRRLRHKAICPIHTSYEGPYGVGIVMDLLDGYDLKKWIEENERRLLETLPERMGALIKVLEGLEEAHQLIVHRDLKPSNIWLKNGRIDDPLILDFGISQTHSNLLSSDLLEKSEQKAAASGTYRYMPPEQLLKPEVVDNRSDIFSFGIMAYEIFTDGRIPPCSLRAYGRTKRVPRISINDIEPPSQYCTAIPPAVDQIVRQSLAYHRLDRPQHVGEILTAFREALPTLISNISSPVGEAAAGDVGLEKVAVPAGAYLIGSTPDSEMRASKPMRRIVLKAFAITVTPITNRQYRLYLDSTGANWPSLINDPVFGASDHPVVGLNWQEAEDFAKWVGGDLPTEAQWEVAAKAGEKFRQYPWGDEPPSPGKANIDAGIGATTPVESFPQARNELGISDLCGNVWEWCRDHWDERFYTTLSNGDEEPLCSSSSNERAIRGGSFESFVEMGRCAFRHFVEAGERRRDIGFRVVFPIDDDERS